jgi:hypothetical protein
MTEFLDHHAARQAPRVTTFDQLRDIEVRVGLPIRVRQHHSNGALWIGADVVRFSTSLSARLQYSVRGHRMTVYVYDSDRFPLRTLASLQPQVVRNRVVFVGERRGYSVAVLERRGLGYAVVTDLAPDEGAALVTAIPED